MLAFFGYQWKENKPGGWQSVITTLIVECSRRNISFKFFGFRESWIFKQITLKNATFLFYDLGKKINFEECIDAKNDVFLITGNNEKLELLRNVNPRILMWNVFPGGIQQQNRYKRIHFRFYSTKLIDYLLNSEAIVFMDGTCLSETLSNTNKLVSTDLLLPVPVNSSRINYYLQREPGKDYFQITFVGRAVRAKVMPVKTIVNQLNKLNDQFRKRIVLNLITDNTLRFKEILGDVVMRFPHEFIDNLSGKEISQYFQKASDLHLAVGVACLEGAMTGVPSMISDSAHNRLPDDYRFQWLFNTKDYSLGEYVKHSSAKRHEKGESLTELVPKMIGDKSLRNALSEKCFAYANTVHHPQMIVDELLIAANKSQGRLNNVLNGYFKNSLGYKIVSKVL